VVESTALEMRHTGNRIGGSNPSLSAIPSFELTKNLWFTPAPLIRRAAAPPTLVGTGFRLLAAVLRK
jgi:hypothetical protein